MEPSSGHDDRPFRRGHEIDRDALERYLIDTSPGFRGRSRSVNSKVGQSESHFHCTRAAAITCCEKNRPDSSCRRRTPSIANTA
jgi:hypothetical protein